MHVSWYRHGGDGNLFLYYFKFIIFSHDSPDQIATDACSSRVSRKPAGGKRR